MLVLRYKNDSVIECGIDEAGRGSLWGPLYAGAVIWKNESDWDDDIRSLSEMIKDSKKITKKKRDMIYEGIKKHALAYGLGIVSAKEIDEMGMTKANKTAFQRALNSLNIIPQRILLDGILVFETAIELINQPEMDNTYLSVAAASILAKVSRDNHVVEYVNANKSLSEKYDLENNKGYGTLKHRNGILKNGKDSLHRDLFLRKLLGNKQSKNTQDTTCAFLDED
jgi:ribonuclease HII